MKPERPPRIISANLLDKAEAYRAQGKFTQALSLTRRALQTDIQPLAPPEVKELSQNETQLALLAVGARLIGESAKSLMKRSLFPWQLQDRAGDWLAEAGPLYSNQDLRDAAAKIKWADPNRDYDFEREFARDIADYLAVLSLIVTGKKEQRLIGLADVIWTSLIASSEGTEKGRDFFTLERNWFLFKTGRADQVDIEEVVISLKKYFFSYGLMNKDRVKALSVRTAIMAEALEEPTVKNLAVGFLRSLNAASAVAKESSKLKLERYRTDVFKAWADIVGNTQGYLQLIAAAHHLGSYQQQRFLNARK